MVLERAKRLVYFVSIHRGSFASTATCNHRAAVEPRLQEKDACIHHLSLYCVQKKPCRQRYHTSRYGFVFLPRVARADMYKLYPNWV